jgi:hypothetical protein
VALARGDLSDAEWRIVEPLLPAEYGRKSRPSHDTRRFLGGFTTKIHARADGQGRPVGLSTSRDCSSPIKDTMAIPSGKNY